ncbi:MAG: hypothetical protein IPJ88_12020 [Myxococcales bacterium]|nr:MAG: hypothetical protein IPJ88_12020 [Myxococcales bacterium]
MRQDLGNRLLRAGLITREQLSSALAQAQLEGGGLAIKLVQGGLNEETLAGVFLADGYGPLVGIEELATADGNAVKRIPIDMAQEFLVLPFAVVAGRLKVAMADPSNFHMVSEIALAASMEVIAQVAYVSDLRVAIEHVHQNADTFQSSSPGASTSPPVQNPSWLQGHVNAPSFPWVAPQSASAHAERGIDSMVGAAHRPAQRPHASPSVRPSGFSDEHLFIPLAASQHGSYAPPSRESVSRFPGPPPSVFGPEETVSYNPPPAPVMPKKVVAKAPPPPAGSSWSDVVPQQNQAPQPSSESVAPAIEHAEDDRAVVPRRRRHSSLIGQRLKSLRPTPTPVPPDAGPTLASIRASRDSDQVLRFACYGAAAVANAAVAMVLRKGMLEGREAAGLGVPKEAIRKIWIPTESPSVFHEVLSSGESYHGPHGQSAADILFRTATGSTGQELLVEPMFLHGRIVALLCVDGVRFEGLGKERVRTLSYAVSEALARILMTQKP